MRFDISPAMLRLLRPASSPDQETDCEKRSYAADYTDSDACRGAGGEAALFRCATG